VAFYLCIALRAHLRNTGRTKNGPNLKSYLDLVALGTIADVVPITGLNRVLVHFGLSELAESRRPGIIQLKRVSGVNAGPVGVGQVGFRLAPRLNATGRLDSADLALSLLLADNERQAGIIADKLEQLNRTRQSVEERILEEADKALGVMDGGTLAPGLAVAGEGWHVGVIGIVASRLTETYYRPSAVIGVHDGVGRGSLRSIPGVNIYKVLERCSDMLDVFGGHPSAAGLTIKEKMVPRFLEFFPEAVAAEAPDLEYEPYISVAAEWPISKCDEKLVEDLARLKPHGIGNPEPSFCARGVLVKWAREGKSNTLLMGLEEKEVNLKAVGFRMGHRAPGPGDRLDVVYTPKLNSWKGEESVQIEVKDFRVLT
jgi:single-stranded-DNA-specific exonuclease